MVLKGVRCDDAEGFAALLVSLFAVLQRRDVVVSLKCAGGG
jgi:hypothetical protein